MINLKGVGVALVTPFDKDHNVDFNAFEKLINHTTTIGVDYFVLHGTTGENPTTSQQEKVDLFLALMEYNTQKRPIVYGLGGNNTAKILQTLKGANFTGIDALLSASPSYNKPSQEGIYQHFIQIADQSSLPIILYNVPGRTSSNIEAETILRLAEHDNIIAIKEASGNISQCLKIAKHKPDGFHLLSGVDNLTTAMISFGADGVISVLANAFGDFVKMTKKALDGDFASASKLLYKFLEMDELMYAESNPAGIKAALSSLDIIQPYLRMPLLAPSIKLQEEIKQTIQTEKLQ